MDVKEKDETINKSRAGTGSVPGAGLGVRHLQVLMLFVGMVLAYAMRVNMSIAVVAMTDPGTDNSFDWSIQTQGVILSSFFWGYIVLQIPAGAMAARFGGTLLITLCVGINAAVSLFLPIVAFYGGWKFVCACRVVQGLAQGLMFPSMHTLIGKWVPVEEKGRLGTFIYAGSELGTALQFIGSGYITEYWGWPAIFYVTGVLGAIWTAAFVFVGSDSPQSSKIISVEERVYIKNSIGDTGDAKVGSTPWRAIATSLPFLSLIVAHCGQNWGFWTLMTEMPSYMNKVLGVDMKSNGLMSAVPYATKYLMSFPVGFMSDLIIRKKWMSLNASRKLFNSIGLYGPALALVVLRWAPAGDVAAAVSLLTVTVALNAAQLAGFMLVHIDMAPNYAGVLMGITNFFGNIMSILAPLAAGAIIRDETDPNEWSRVFYLASGIYIAGNTVFLIFGTTDRQSWNNPDTMHLQKESDKKSEEKTGEAVV